MPSTPNSPLGRPASPARPRRRTAGASAGPAVAGTTPARAADLTGLPPAFVAICEFDPLRDEGLRYAQRLPAAGVSVELHLYPGTFHGCTLARDAAVTRRMAADADTALRRALH
ncbi:hypothetical protein NRB56_33220 [Nocardia sp. RB56]|uniref:Alpha/beta hydrolase fold-3 domain-containing protein n=1 Tax=Nocardia aurantia TaxID=2585199 RepID=A0A7K0DPS4_9NOCA|nr:hypothetical protein [Nocardia aurantia]